MEKYKKYSSYKKWLPAGLLPSLLLLTLMLPGCDKTPAPAPPPAPPPDYTACAPVVADSTFELVAWNIENFPVSGRATEEVARILTTFGIDLVAFQEVRSEAEMNRLLDLLPGWEGRIAVSGPINTGYLYKTSEVALDNFREIYTDLWSPFPRPPVVAEVTHHTGQTYTLINIHLKCCGGADNVARRAEASRLLKEYIDTNLPDVPVILLGDFNDEITAGSEPTPFQNFIDDSLNYRFADWEVATGPPANWSYPSWPSHIDHILITNELFEREDTTHILKPDNCYDSYLYRVSDHRPVFLRLE